MIQEYQYTYIYLSDPQIREVIRKFCRLQKDFPFFIMSVINVSSEIKSSAINYECQDYHMINRGGKL